MAYSEAGIVNLALYLLGSVGTISALNDGTPNAVRALVVYEYIRDEVLEAFPWKFSKARVELAADATAPACGYEYRYALPSDCLKILEITDDLSKKNTIKYEVESGYVLTDYDNTAQGLFCLYIKKVIDPTQFSPSFINVLAYRLAEELALAVVNDKQIASGMGEKYRDALLRAKGVDVREGYVEDVAAWDDVGRDVISTMWGG